MGQGIQVWDASGNLIMDVGTRVTRVIDVINSTAASGSRSYASVDNRLRAILAGAPPLLEFGGSVGGNVPDIVVSGKTVSWSGGGINAVIVVLGD